jgi:hypothetical protein
LAALKAAYFGSKEQMVLLLFILVENHDYTIQGYLVLFSEVDHGCCGQDFGVQNTLKRQCRAAVSQAHVISSAQFQPLLMQRKA